MAYVRMFGGILIAAVLILWGMARIAFEIIGASTAPDDFELLKQRMPRMLEWLFATPWPVPTLLMLGMTGAAAWLIISATRKGAQEGAATADENKITLEDIERAVDERMASQGTLDNQDGFESSLQAVRDEIAATKKVARDYSQAYADAIKDRLSKLEERLEKLVSYAEQNRAYHDERIDWIGQSIAFIGQWDWHTRNFPALLERGEALRPVAFAPVSPSEWLDWRKREQAWRSDVTQWAQIAEFSAPNISSALFDKNDRDYQDKLHGAWKFDEDNFENSSQIAVYKDAMIVLSSLKHTQAHIERRMRANAFDGAGKKGWGESPKAPGGDFQPPQPLGTE